MDRYFYVKEQCIGAPPGLYKAIKQWNGDRHYWQCINLKTGGVYTIATCGPSIVVEIAVPDFLDEVSKL